MCSSSFTGTELQYSLSSPTPPKVWLCWSQNIIAPYSQSFKYKQENKKTKTKKHHTHTKKRKKNTTKETTKKTPHNFSFSSRSNPSQFEVINIFHPPKYLLIALHQLCPSNQQDITENWRAVSLKALVSIKLHTETKPKPWQTFN